MFKSLSVILFAVFCFYFFTGSQNLNDAAVQSTSEDTLTFEGEKHLKNIRQLTFGGENAEAYFAFDGNKLSFQSTREGHECDQIYKMNHFFLPR